MYSKDYEELCKRVEVIDKKAAEYMRGDARNLNCFAESDDIAECFEWKCTAQGCQYWKNIENILNGHVSLNDEIKRHKQRLNMTQTQLSKAIGKSKNYLSEMINRGCSKEKEQEIIALLNDLKSDNEIIAELSQGLADAQDQCISLRDETSRLYAALSDSNREIKEAAEELDRAKVIMSFYFLAAVFIVVFIGVFLGWI